jgi:CotH kinase protein/Lamin Tail Domain/Fn3 associated
MKKSLFVLLFLVNQAFAQVTTGLYINEIMASNDATITDNARQYSDWIELYNSNNTSVDLAGYYMSDALKNLTKFRFTNLTGKVVIPANGRLLIWASGAVERGVKHTNFSLSASGEDIVLVAPDGKTIIDSFSFGKQRADVSYGRIPNGGTNFKYFSPSTPDASNFYKKLLNTFDDIIDPPFFSHTGGFYSESFPLTISHNDPNVTIYYTIDGSIPSKYKLTPTLNAYKNVYPETPTDSLGPILCDRTYQSYTYTKPLDIYDRSNAPNFVSQVTSTYDSKPSYLPSTPLYKGTVIRAIAYKSGSLPSEIITHTFFFTPTGTNKYTFPVVSLAIQEDHLFNYYNGIYVAGITFEEMLQKGNFNPCEGNYSLYNNRKPSNFEMIVNEHSVISKQIEVGIHGGCTKAFRLKSLNLYGKSDFDYAVFPNSPKLFHRNLILRNSGQDAGLMLFRDALYQNMVRHLNIDVQDYQPAIVFINGEYWGIENLREKHDKHYISKVYGANPDSLDIIEIPGFLDAEEGDLTHFDNMFSYIRDNDMANDSLFAIAKTQMDMNSFMDYMIAEIFSGNTDWPQNNVRLWRKRTTQYMPDAPYGQDGRWRWMLLDMDYSLGFGKDYSFNSLEYATKTDVEVQEMLKELLKNESYRNDFINRFADLLNSTFLSSRTIAMLYEAKQKYAPEINAHIDRWKTIDNYATWEENIENTKDFLLKRPEFQRSDIREKWDIKGEYNLTVDVSNTKHGYVRVNTIDILPTTAGLNATPYPWTGSYFNDIPIQISPIAKEGYKFKHWLHNSIILTDSLQTITTNTACSYIAVFEQKASSLKSMSDVSIFKNKILNAGLNNNFMRFAYTINKSPNGDSRIGGLYNQNLQMKVLSEKPFPVAANLGTCGYFFKNWSLSAARGTSPDAMLFVYEADKDANMSDFANEFYNETSNTRINGLGDLGVSFVSKGDMGKYSGAILALNTMNKSQVSVSWIGRTIKANTRTYRIRLQYRIGDILPFNDLLDQSGNKVEYLCDKIAGSDSLMKDINLPIELLNQPYIQLFWRYYRIRESKDIGDELGIDDILIKSEINLQENSKAGSNLELANNIFSASNTSVSSKMSYQASQSITLSAGFRADSKGVFTAEIMGCR